MKFFGKLEKAVFLSRPNRFTVLCNLEGKEIRAFLPNPGRLLELLLPDVTLFLEKNSNRERMTSHTVIAIEKENIPVMVHTHRTNDIAHFLIDNGLVPGLEGLKVSQREIVKGRSRFDFLLKSEKKEIILEVKSCTLFSKRAAMFPDAVTLRGKRHVEELFGLSLKGENSSILFLISSPYAEFFLPEYHTDIDFAKALLSAKEKIKIIPLSLKWNMDLSLDLSKLRVLSVPWKTLEREADDRGSYLLILRLQKDKTVETGGLGRISFRKGFYAYVGSARKNLSERIERHKRLRKKLFWHIDYLRAATDFYIALPIRSSEHLECRIAYDLKNIADREIEKFGCSDCKCSSHLFWIEQNPLNSAKFHTFLQFYRMERLMGEKED